MLVATALLAWLPLPSARAAEALRLALSRTPLSLPFYVAEQAGYFAAEGANVRIEEVIGGHRSLQRLFDGAADLATCSEVVVMFNSFRRADFAILASFVNSGEDVRVVAGRDSGIASAADLAGKRVGTVIGASSHYYLATLALLNGTDPKSIRLVNLQPEAMAPALRNGEVDAVAIWQPFAYQSAQVAGARTLPDDRVYTETFNLVVSRGLAGRREEDLVRVLRAVERAQQLIAREPARAEAVLRERLGLDPDYAKWLLPRYRYELTLDQSLLKTLESEARWARAEGLVAAARSPNYLEFVHAAPLRRVRPAAAGINE